MSEQWIELHFVVRTTDPLKRMPLEAELFKLVPGGFVVEDGDGTLGVRTTSGEGVGYRLYLAPQAVESARYFIADAVFRLLGERFEATSIKHYDVQAGWRDGWREFFEPVVVNPDVLVIAPWHQPERYAEHHPKEVIAIEPGLAFGTGQHETTQLCLDRLWRHYTSQQPLPKSLLDVGCGSGVIAVLAAKMGFEHVVGVDIDLAAVAAAKENAIRNGVESVCHFSSKTPCQLNERFEVVVANILFPILVSLKDELTAAVADAGQLMLSGILASQLAEARAVFLPLGFVEISNHTLGKWLCLHLQKSQICDTTE